MGGASGPWGELNWIYQAHCNGSVCAIPSLPSDPRPVSSETQGPPDLVAVAVHSWHCWLQTSLQPGTEVHQEGFSLPIYNPAVCHAMLLLGPCSESTAWICILSSAKHTWKPRLSIPLRATTLVSIQTKGSWEYFLSTRWKTYQVLCATAFLSRHKSL